MSLRNLTALATVLAMASPASTQSFTTRHRDDVVALQLDPRVVAVQTAGAASTAELLEGLAVSVNRVMPLGDVVLLDVPAGMSAVQHARAVLASHEQVFVTPVFVDDFGGPLLPTPELFVRFEAHTPAAERAVLLAAIPDGSVVEGPSWAGLPGAYKLTLANRDGEDVLRLANQLNDLSGVAWAQPNWIFSGRGAFVPNDPLYSDSWHLENTGQAGGTPDEDMDASSAWDVTTGNPAVTVVVIDAGVQQNHPDINQVPGEDFVFEPSGGDAFNACDNHGTPVAGLISAILDNGLGTSGVAATSPTASARTFISDLSCNGSWSTFFESTPNALAWAETIGARVTNNSNFYGFTDVATEDKYAQTRADGMVHFASAGNFATSTVVYPASLPSIVAVSATDRFGTLASFSSWGVGLGVAAPGLDTWASDRTGFDGYSSGDTTSFGGTSAASPLAAAVGALIVGQDLSLTAAEVETKLFDSCVDHGAAGYDTVFGWGIVNAGDAVETMGTWTDRGFGLAGVLGAPLLEALGPQTGGSLVELELSGSVPFSTTALVIGLSKIFAPFKGGAMVPAPDIVLGGLPLDGAGDLDISFVYPGGVPSGTSIAYQYWTTDVSGPLGFSASNAVEGTSP
jgi:subtilisin family serine protease